jgi:DNA-directed RNA polymerase subunit RPC12/RpoP
MKSPFRRSARYGKLVRIHTEPEHITTESGGQVALQAINAKCSNCGREFRAVPKKSFLAFQKMRCPGCSKDVVYPLTKGYRVIYWVIVALILVVVVINVSNGQVTYPTLLGFAAVFALVEDARIRKATAAR